MSKIRILLITISLLASSLCFADASKIVIMGRKDATVLGRVIYLEDIAEVSCGDFNQDSEVLRLKRIALQNSPNPGESTTLSAHQILEVLNRANIDRSKVGYSFPPIISISRASRIITNQEVKDAISNAINTTTREIQVKKVFFDQLIRVAAGQSTIRAYAVNNSNNRGRTRFDVVVSVEGEPETKFSVTSEIDEWGMVPVASRQIQRGEVVKSEDLKMARLNLDALTEDAAQSENQIIGYETNSNIPQGETFKRRNLKIPPVIQANTKVTLLYSSGPLNATATGIALEEGIEGQRIQVRNDSSKKVIHASVVEPGLVKVEAQ